MAKIEDPPILNSFQIQGLHGCKNVTLNFAGPARVVIAENGMGKTTILSALQAFLTKSFSRLHNLHFDAIKCYSTSFEEPLILNKGDLPQLIDSGAEENLRELSQYTEIETSELQDAIVDSNVETISDIMSTPVLREIYLESPYSTEKMLDYVREIKSEILQSRSDDIQELISLVSG